MGTKTVKAMTVCALVAASGVGHAPAGAEAPATEITFVNGVDLNFLQGMAERQGHVVEQAVNRLNEAVVIANTATGLRYGLVGMNCEAPDALNCSGLQMMMILSPLGEPPLDEINLLNYNRAAVSVWRSPAEAGAETGAPPEYGVNRYMILDHGVTPENIEVNLGVFLQAAQGVKEAFER
ncbi:MAG: hypothetical protein AAGJ32_08615 [Pseudomonadota bacterium]